MHKGSKVVKRKQQWGLIDTAAGPVRDFSSFFFSCTHLARTHTHTHWVFLYPLPRPTHTKALDWPTAFTFLTFILPWIVKEEDEHKLTGRQRQGRLGLWSILLTCWIKIFTLWGSLCYRGGILAPSHTHTLVHTGRSTVNKLWKGIIKSLCVVYSAGTQEESYLSDRSWEKNWRDIFHLGL